MSTLTPLQIRPVGDHALLLELADNAAVHGLARLAREVCGARLAEVVPGHATLLLVGEAGSGAPDPSALLAAAAGSERSWREGQDGSNAAVRTIPVRYGGADLASAAAALGVSSEAVVAMHCGADYIVAFIGFAPGFPYLVCEEPSALLDLPRRATPRTEVPAGSVAVAAGYCGIYPRSSPGGWNLLGRTDAVMFDAQREPPALLEPGLRVRFEPA